MNIQGHEHKEGKTMAGILNEAFRFPPEVAEQCIDEISELIESVTTIFSSIDDFNISEEEWPGNALKAYNSVLKERKASLTDLKEVLLSRAILLRDAMSAYASNSAKAAEQVAELSNNIKQMQDAADDSANLYNFN